MISILSLQVLFAVVLCLGQYTLTEYPGSGSGEESTSEPSTTTSTPVTDPPTPFDYEEFIRQYLLDRFCSSRPDDVCEKSATVCPCGSIRETILYPNVFHVLEYLPCNPISTTAVTFRDCDTFLQYAATLAFSGIDKHQDLEYLYYHCFSITPHISQPDNIPTHTIDLQTKYLMSQEDLLGAIGPNNPDSLEIFPYVLGETYKKLTISYSTSQDIVDYPDKYPYFYSTVPPPEFFMRAILKLLSEFGWHRVGIISTRDKLHLRNSELLIKLGSLKQNFPKNNSQNTNFTFLFPNAYDEDPLLILEQFKADDYRIFVANVESSKARNLFCQALKLSLTTELHQWILPSFYNYKWWEGPDECSDNDTNCCTNDQILKASMGTIFVGESTIEYSENTTENVLLQVVDEVYERTLLEINVNVTQQDRLFLLHSRLLYIYDAVLLYAVAFNSAIRNLTLGLQNTTQDDGFCNSLVTPLKPYKKNILTEKMNEILNSSAFCGYSGYYILGNSNTLGQAWITQFQYYEDCKKGIDLGSFGSNSTGCYKESDIGRYSNFDKPTKCELFTLELVNEIDNLRAFESEEFKFRNSCCQDISDLISSRPYKWKGDNPWTPPTDGACYRDSCHCLNQLGPPEIALGFIITFCGIFFCCALILLNCLLRKNKHFKASNIRFNVILIVNCMFRYLVPLFTSLLLSGNYFNNYENLIPISCEIVKWISNIGLTVILSMMVCRNWRIYRIFFNPRMEKRRLLSDYWIMLYMIILVIPALLIIIAWTVFDGYQYEEFMQKDECPSLDVPDSIETFQVTHRCTANYITLWEGIILGYGLLLGSLLILLVYQNLSIASDFAEEREFASKAMFFITLFLIPMFALNVIANDSDNSLNIRLHFWSKVGYGTIFPTLLLIGLYLPKFIEIVKDKQSSYKHKGKVVKVYNIAENKSMNQK